MQQLDQKSLELTQAAENLRNSRKADKAYFDLHHRLRSEDQQLHVGDLVLLLTPQQQGSRYRATKLDDRWTGPYRIWEVTPDSTFYRLEELDGTQRAVSFAGNRLKKFFPRNQRQFDRDVITEYRRGRIPALRERPGRGTNPGRLQELMDMVEAARSSRGTSGGHENDGNEEVENAE